MSPQLTDRQAYWKILSTCTSHCGIIASIGNWWT